MKKMAETGEVDAGANATEAKKKTKMKKMEDKTPVQFAKALREYEEKQEQKAADRKKIEDDIKDRNRARRETAKKRAVKGDLINHKTKKGQPRMNTMLELLTSKIQQDT